MQSSPVLSLSSPSFNSYSSGNLAEIAARVVQEFRDETGCEFDDMFGFQDEEKVKDKDLGEERQLREEEEEVEEEADDSGVEDEDDDGFEFPCVCGEPTSPISADEIFCNGQIRPVFPLFDRSLLFADVGNGNGKVNPSKPPAPTIRLPLRKLMNEDRDPPSCSSSEADELDGVPAETYCVWTPKAAAAESPGSCRKSNSTGSSKRWKFRDLLHRSNSDGKDTFVFLSPSNANSKKKDEKAADNAKTLTEKSSFESKANEKMKPKVIGGEVVPVTESHDTIQATNQLPAALTKDGDRRRSFWPYRQDLVGIFANVNGISRNVPTF